MRSGISRRRFSQGRSPPAVKANCKVPGDPLAEVFLPYLILGEVEPALVRAHVGRAGDQFLERRQIVPGDIAGLLSSYAGHKGFKFRLVERERHIRIAEAVFLQGEHDVVLGKIAEMAGQGHPMPVGAPECRSAKADLPGGTVIGRVDNLLLPPASGRRARTL